jgi:hypothetical protein
MHQLLQATMGIPAVSMLTTYDNLCHYGFLSHHGILWWLADGREVQEHANQHVKVCIGPNWLAFTSKYTKHMPTTSHLLSLFCM